jgi:hypothetical protein
MIQSAAIFPDVTPISAEPDRSDDLLAALDAKSRQAVEDIVGDLDASTRQMILEALALLDAHDADVPALLAIFKGKGDRTLLSDRHRAALQHVFDLARRYRP